MSPAKQKPCSAMCALATIRRSPICRALSLQQRHDRRLGGEWLKAADTAPGAPCLMNRGRRRPRPTTKPARDRANGAQCLAKVHLRYVPGPRGAAFASWELQRHATPLTQGAAWIPPFQQAAIHQKRLRFKIQWPQIQPTPSSARDMG